MLNAYDIAYALGVGISAPYWLLKPSARRKVLRAFALRMGDVPPRDPSRPAVMIHAVSLGEINATRGLVTQLRTARADLDIIVSTATDTGFDRAMQLYGGQSPVVRVIRFPLDFSSAINRCLDALRPALVVLLELEVWPNFMRHCQRRGVPVVLVNGRLTESSFRHYRLGGLVTRRMFARLTAACVQDEQYARRFEAIGVPHDRLKVTGTMKFDTATVADSVPGDRELAEAVGLRPAQEPIWVCGSTGPGEEEIVLRVYRQLLKTHPALRLAIIPRHPQRFDEVARLITQAGFPLLRRSRIRDPQSEIRDAVILGDTMGELRKFCSLADVVFVGRSLVDLGPRQHGSDMIEPAALGKATVVGPYTANFADAVRRLVAEDGLFVVPDERALGATIDELLRSPDKRRAAGERAQQVVRSAQGATARHVQVILDVLGR